MKRIGCILLLLAIALSAFAGNVVKNMDTFVQTFRDRMYISYVYVSKSMMNMMEARNTLSGIPGINGEALRGKLSTVQIIGVNNEVNSKRILRQHITEDLDSGFEKLLRIEGVNGSTEIYFRSKSRSEPAAIVMIEENGGSYKVIVFTGTFTLEDVTKTMERKKS